MKDIRQISYKVLGIHRDMCEVNKIKKEMQKEIDMYLFSMQQESEYDGYYGLEEYEY